MSTQSQAVATQQPKRSLVATLAAQYDMEPGPFLEAIQQTVMPHDDKIHVTTGMVAAFLMVCNEYKLNPFTREIFAFPTRSGGIQPVVSIDGWVRLVTTHPKYAGMEIKMDMDPDKKSLPVSVTVQIFRNDNIRVPPITEYYDECYRNTEPWNKMPKRLMRHKGIKEAGRVAFGFGGITDEDESRDAINITDESTVLERSTATKAEAMKEKLGAIKEAKAPKAEIPAPKEAPAPESPKPPQEKPVEKPKASEPPVDTVITPKAVVEPGEKASAEQRQSFLDALQDKAVALGCDEATAKAKARELIFNIAGAAKFADVESRYVPELLKAIDQWA